jgi:hypothetical protein
MRNLVERLGQLIVAEIERGLGQRSHATVELRNADCPSARGTVDNLAGT